MKRIKTDRGSAVTTSGTEFEERRSLRKSVAATSATLRSTAREGSSSSAKTGKTGNEVVVSKGRKSCPSLRQNVGVMSNAAAFLTPEQVASVFEAGEGSLSEVERRRVVGKLVLCFQSFEKSPANGNGLSTAAFAKVLKTLQTHVDSMNDQNWNVTLQAIKYAMTPSNCGSCYSNLEILINEILVHKPNYSNAILNTLISKLVRPPSPVKNNGFEDDGPSISERKSFDVSVKLICKIIQVLGMKCLSRSLINMMTSSYPYILRPALTHFYYLRNLLEINKVIGSSMTFCVLSVIFHKLTQLDAFLPRELLESEALQDIVLPKQEKTGTNPTESFIIPEEDSEDLVAEVIRSYAKVASQVDQAQQIATMDISLSYLISFLHSVHENLNFPSLISIFETEILPTFNTNCVQFAFFYLINLKEEYMNAFLDALWKKFLTISTPMVIRIQSLGFMAGVLARSTKADRRILKRWISRLSTYAQEYLTNRSSSSAVHWSNVNIHAHGPFYAACQAIFYVFAFRHFEIVYGNLPHLKDEDKNGKKPSMQSLPPPSSTSFIYTLNLQRLITCDLNPLKACSPTVAKTFVDIAHAYQISYCKTVLDRNNRATIRNMIYGNMREVTNNAETAGVNLLTESFFPFDPLPLAYAKQLVDEKYRVYDNNSVTLTLVGESVCSSKSRRRGESESQDILCDDLDLEAGSRSDAIDGQDILLVSELY